MFRLVPFKPPSLSSSLSFRSLSPFLSSFSTPVPFSHGLQNYPLSPIICRNLSSTIHPTFLPIVKLSSRSFADNTHDRKKAIVEKKPETENSDEDSRDQSFEDKYFAVISRGGWLLFALGIALIAAWYHQVTEVVPSTGRRRWLEQSEATIQAEGKKALDELLQQYPSRLDADNEMSLTMENVIRSLSYDRAELTSVHWVPIILISEKPFFYSYPGGELVVSTGMLSFLKTETELACLIAHSMGHMVSKHHLESALSLAKKAQTKSNRAALEREADEIALQILTSACYDPDKMSDFWLKMEALLKKKGSDEYIQSHKWKDRIQALEKELLPPARFKRDALACCGGKDRPLSTVNLPKAEASQFY